MTLTEARKLRKLKQGQIAADLGITSVALSYIEHGKVFPTKTTRRKIEQYLGVKINWLATRFPDHHFRKVEGPSLDIVIAIYEFVFANGAVEPVERIAFLQKSLKSLGNTL